MKTFLRLAAVGFRPSLRPGLGGVLCGGGFRDRLGSRFSAGFAAGFAATCFTTALTAAGLRRDFLCGFGRGSFGGFGGGGFGLLAERVEDDAEHLFFWRRLAGEDFELARALLHEHLDAGDDGDGLLARHADERRFQRVVDEVEDELGVEVLGFEDGGRLVAGHAYGSGVDDDVEGGLGDGVLLDGLGAGLAGEFLRGLGVRLRMKTSAPRSRTPKTAARAAPPAPSTRTFAPRRERRFSSGPTMPATSVLKP